GLSRMHHVPAGDRPAQTLRPHPRSLEGLRARFGRRHPGASRLLGALAIVVLLIGVALMVPQAAELITSIPPVAERVGTFTSPIQLPTWLNITVTVAGVLAALERALTLRNHWLIDAEATWTSFVLAVAGSSVGRMTPSSPASTSAPASQPGPDPLFADPRLAACYDVFDGARDDLPHYHALLAEHGARSVLDVGCGTGSLAVLLAADGLAVTG